ncbi:zinc transporter [Roseovarius sp. A21]|uniref:High-affinity zinc uptake system protein ZnuA n=1 Tax=Roseovarius bejariae TaxID=2576383 RepID=A0A844CZD3_9RHOB|nr:zinc ABC transporter substrate-binding protein [Roseovarius bejariae]MRU15970.1 zinc transporter [Roseovarius bejariae]
MRTTVFGVAALLLAQAAQAETPKVATDIAPIQSLVATVMDGVDSPDVVVRVGQSPHGYAMRPSEAKALGDADLVVWVGEELTPWMEQALDSLAGEAKVITLLELPDTVVLETRDNNALGAAGHDDSDHGAERAEHDHGHDETDHDDHGAHDHDGTDPHAWLDPVNATAWLGVIAEELAALDPANAATYRDNAKAGQEEIEALQAAIEAQLDSLRAKEFLVFHDAYQYFEQRFGLTSAGALSLSDASDPGPKRLAALRDLVAEHDIQCVFAEPQFNTDVIGSVFGDDIRLGTLDPLGMAQTEGPGQYIATLKAIGDEVAQCLAGES